MDNKDLIKQYVNTGVRLPDTQVAKLNDNLKKSYMRLRMISVLDRRLTLNDYEYSIASDEDKEKYFNYLIKNREKLSERQYKHTPDDVREKYILKLINNRMRLSQHNLVSTSPELRWKYFNTLIQLKGNISDNELMMMPHDMIYKYLEQSVEANNELTSLQYKGLSDELKWKYMMNNIGSSRGRIDYEELENTPPELVFKYLNKKVEMDLPLNYRETSIYTKLKNEQ